MEYQVTGSQLEFEGRLLRIRTDQVEGPDGYIQQIEVVEHPGAVAIIPLGPDGNVWFVEQYRHPAQKKMVEIPAGTLNPDEPPADCAQRECREEIGMAAGELIPLGAAYIAPGYSTELLHFFLARALTPSALAPDEGEDLVLRKIPLEKAWQDALDGHFIDIKTIAGLAMARAFLATEAAAAS